MKNWRQLQLSQYVRPELTWTQRSYVQTQMMVEDRYFYDPVTRKYTVDRYLDDLDHRYGGIDSVLGWPVYSNIGIDNRNQHDVLRALPGGYAGVRQMVAYPLGASIDRMNPIRLVTPLLMFVSLVNFLSFQLLRGPWTLLICLGVLSIGIFAYGIASSVLNVEVYPREKIGQFCSACQVSASLTSFVFAVPIGVLIDYINDYRYTFLWSAVFQFIAALMFIKVCFNWKARE